jgi:hypothetical protein
MIPWPDAIAMGSEATAKAPLADVSLAPECREELQQNDVLLGVDFVAEVAELLRIL